MPVERIEVKPAIIEWMFERTGKHPDQEDAPSWTREASGWLRGAQPTLKQLLGVARSAHIPYDYLLRDTPPPRAETPLPDMRTIENREIAEPSLELLEVIHLCQWRQEWYKDYLLRTSNAWCDFVGSVSLQDSAERVAGSMRELLQLPAIPDRGSWEDRLKQLTDAAEKTGVLVMRMSQLGSWHRRLDPEEFRGFALSDHHAPLMFINGADSKGAQAFTFAHEFAHLMLGHTALSGSQRPTEEERDEEQWCNAVAAEFLVPGEDFLQHHHLDMGALARRYKVSSLVILIRHKTLGVIDRKTFQERYDAEKARIDEKKQNFAVRGGTRKGQINAASPQLCRAVISSVREESVTFREAFRLLNLKNTKALEEVGDLVGAPL